MRMLVTRVTTVGVVSFALACTVSGCSSALDNSIAQHLSVINADPSLFAPPIDNKYSLKGEILSASVVSQGVPLEQVTTAANGSITVTDGIMSSATIVATIDHSHQVKFELSEPVMFERSGQVSDMIVGVGKLTTSSGITNDVKIFLSPHYLSTERNSSTERHSKNERNSDPEMTLDALIEIPPSLISGYEQKPNPLKLKLEVIPAV